MGTVGRWSVTTGLCAALWGRAFSFQRHTDTGNMSPRTLSVLLLLAAVMAVLLGNAEGHYGSRRRSSRNWSNSYSRLNKYNTLNKYSTLNRFPSMSRRFYERNRFHHDDDMHYIRRRHNDYDNYINGRLQYVAGYPTYQQNRYRTDRGYLLDSGAARIRGISNFGRVGGYPNYDWYDGIGYPGSSSRYSQNRFYQQGQFSNGNRLYF